MLIDTDIYKTEKEIADMYGKFPASINRSIQRAEKTGKKVAFIEAFGLRLYDIRTLPDTITKGDKKDE